MHSFGSDRPLLFDVQPWKRLGYGCPNFGFPEFDHYLSANESIAGLVDEIGRDQLFIMRHQDAMRRQAPSINTLARISKLIARVYSVLSARAKPYSQQRVEGGHADPETFVFVVHPVPYFGSENMQNKWLREYNLWTMRVLAHMMQHSDNNLPATVTQEFANEVMEFFNEI